jgi:hypothetical protein
LSQKDKAKKQEITIIRRKNDGKSKLQISPEQADKNL